MMVWRPCPFSILFFRLGHGSHEAIFKAVRFLDQHFMFGDRGEYRIEFGAVGRRCFASLRFGCHYHWWFLLWAGRPFHIIANARVAFARLVKGLTQGAREQRPAPTLF